MNYDVVEVVIDKLVRTFRLRDWQYDIEDIAEDIAEALKLIGAAKNYEPVTKTYLVTNRMIKLPIEAEHIMQVSPPVPYREQGRFIVIDLADNSPVTVTYQTLPTDERGFPIVPDNAAVREAIMWYLVKILTLQGEIKRIPFDAAEQEWQWRCGSARGELNVMGVQQWSQVANDFTRLNPLKDQHLKEYKEVGKPNTLDRGKSEKYNR
jgi:hypothetical protein